MRWPPHRPHAAVLSSSHLLLCECLDALSVPRGLRHNLADELDVLVDLGPSSAAPSPPDGRYR